MTTKNKVLTDIKHSLQKDATTDQKLRDEDVKIFTQNVVIKVGWKKGVFQKALDKSYY